MSRWLGGRGLWAERASRTIDSFLALMDGREAALVQFFFSPSSSRSMEQEEGSREDSELSVSIHLCGIRVSWTELDAISPCH
jgi:hypothetical protein